MKVRIAMAGYLPSDQRLFGKLDLLLDQLTEYLCKDNANADIQILMSPSYIGGEWMNWNQPHEFPVSTYLMQDESAPVEECAQSIRMDTSFRSLPGEAMCDKADALIIVWNEDVTELSGATWELIRIAYNRKAPCIWISTKSKNIYCLWESYYRQYSPQYLETFCEPLPDGELQPGSVEEQNGKFLSFWEKRRINYLKKYKADTAVHPSEEDCLMRQDFAMESEDTDGENIRQILLKKFEQFDKAAVKWNGRFQTMLYERSILPFITTIFLAVGFYAETLIGKTFPGILPDFADGIVVTFAAVLAGIGFLVHGFMNFYVYRLSKSKRIEQWQKEFLYDRYVAEMLRVMIHFLPYGMELNFRKLCAREPKIYMTLKHLADDVQPNEQNLNRRRIRCVLQHAEEMLQEQMAYHETSIKRYENIVKSLEKWGKNIFYIGFAVILSRGGLQFILALFPISAGDGGLDWNSIVRSFLNMLALLLPAWSGYFFTKMQQNNFHYNLDNHQNMLVKLNFMHKRIINSIEQEDISIEVINVMIEELAEVMLVEDTLGWQQQYMSSTVKPL